MKYVLFTLGAIGGIVAVLAGVLLVTKLPESVQWIVALAFTMLVIWWTIPASRKKLK